MTKKKILIVDDEPNNLHVLRQILKELYLLSFAPDGEKALEAVAKHEPDLILLDIMMPGMSGYEVCESGCHPGGARNSAQTEGVRERRWRQAGANIQQAIKETRREASYLGGRRPNTRPWQETI